MMNCTNCGDQLPPLEDERPTDDSEVEITPLDQPYTTSRPTLLRRLAHIRLQPRQRMITLRIGVVLGLLLLALLIFPASFPTLRDTVIGMSSSLIPTPTPTLFPGEDSFYGDVSVPWTQVLIDNHPVRLPIINHDAPLRLKYGHHLVTWLADPFEAQSCWISVPQSIADTCRLAPDDSDQQSQGPIAQILQLHNSLSTLRTDAQTGLINAVRQALAQYPAAQSVQPGELYVDPTGSTAIVTAAQPLQATLHFQFDPQQTANQPYIIASEECQQLCILPWQYLPSQKIASLGAREWLALAFISSSWSYATQSGHIIAHDQPIDLGAANGGTYPILLRISWNGFSWHIRPLIGLEQVPPIVVSSGPPHDPSTPADKMLLNDDPSCVAARDLLSDPIFSDAQKQFISGPNPATGCLAALISDTTSTPTSSPSPIAYFLEHFGVLLAVNDAAHKLQPYAPRADAYERSLAEQLAVHAGQTIT